MNIVLEFIYEIFPFKRRREREQFDQLLRSIPVIEKYDPDYVHEEILPGLKLLLQESLEDPKWDVFRFKEVEQNAQALGISTTMAAMFMRGNLIEIRKDNSIAVMPPKSDYWSSIVIVSVIIFFTAIGGWSFFDFLLNSSGPNRNIGALIVLANLVLILFLDLILLYLLKLYTTRKKKLKRVHNGYLSLKEE